jgi:transposase
VEDTLMKKEMSWEERIRLPEPLWLRLLEVLPKFKRGRPSHKTKNFIEAVLFRFRTGIPWRDLPPDFGPWKNTYNRFNRWVKSGYFFVIFDFLKKTPMTPMTSNTLWTVRLFELISMRLEQLADNHDNVWDGL